MKRKKKQQQKSDTFPTQPIFPKDVSQVCYGMMLFIMGHFFVKAIVS